MITNSNSICYNPSLFKLDSAAFSNINIPSRHESQSQKDQSIDNKYFDHNIISQQHYLIAQSQLFSKMTRLNSILNDKLVYRTIKSGFDEILFTSCLPKLQSSAEIKIVEVLRINLDKIFNTIGDKLKQHKNIGLSKIIRIAVLQKNGKTERNHRYSELTLKQNQNHNNMFYDNHNTFKRNGDQQREVFSFCESMHRLLDGHILMTNPEAYRTTQRTFVAPPSPGLDKNKFQNEKSKSKYQQKKY